MRRPFRVRGETIRVVLDPDILDVLESLPEMLDSIGETDRDPAALRLSPRAHPEDAVAESKFQELTADELARARGLDRREYAETIEAVRAGKNMDPEQAESWLRVIGEARLALGARLGIEHDGWEATASNDPTYALLGYLGFLQEELVAAVGGLVFGDG